jgi:type IV pilus assembly protein PilW
MNGLMHRCAGVGLVEMLVALAIGMLVTLASAAMLVTANGDYLHHGATVRLNDGGRYALELIGQALRQAGYADAALPGGAAPAAEEGAGIEGLDARSLTRTGPGIADARAPSVNGSDVLAVRFGGAGSGSGDGSIVDCAGFAVGATQQGWSIFYVAPGDDGEAELRCKYRTDSGGWSADAVVRGIDSFQVLYGVDTDTPVDGVANRYLNAAALRALDDALVVAGPSAAERERERRRRSHWHRVVAVRVALLLHGESGTRAGGTPIAYDLFGAAYTAAARGGDAGTRIDEAALPAPLRARARRLFESAVLLRNRAGS